MIEIFINNKSVSIQRSVEFDPSNLILLLKHLSTNRYYQQEIAFAISNPSRIFFDINIDNLPFGEFEYILTNAITSDYDFKFNKSNFIKSTIIVRYEEPDGISSKINNHNSLYVEPTSFTYIEDGERNIDILSYGLLKYYDRQDILSYNEPKYFLPYER